MHRLTRSACVAVAVVGLAAEAAADRGQLSRRLDALESRLQRLESRPQRDGLTVRRAEEVRALVADVLADADTRASLQDGGPTAGWDDEFFIQSADGNFRLEISGQLQVRHVWNRRQRPSDTALNRAGFEVRRAKIKLDGHLLTPDLQFTVGTAHNTSAGTFLLQSFNVRYRLSDELTVLAGRARPPLLREEEVSSKRQLAVERSLVARTFRQTRTLGVMLRYRTERLRVSTGFMDASVIRADDPDDPGFVAGPEDDRWRASGRAEVLLAGRWKDLSDYTSFPDDDPALMLGAGILFQDEEKIDPAENDTELLRWSADVSVELGGANAFVAIVGNRVAEETMPTLDQLGFVVQGGYFLTEHWELFARYEWGDADGLAQDLSVITVGFNRYIAQHTLKWTADIGYGLNPVDDFWSSRGAGYLDDRPGEDGQVVVRVQLQMLF